MNREDQPLLPGLETAEPAKAEEMQTAEAEQGPKLTDRGDMVLASMGEKTKKVFGKAWGVGKKILGFAGNVVKGGIGAGHWAYEKSGQLKDTAIQRGTEAYAAASASVEQRSKAAGESMRNSYHGMRNSLANSAAERLYGNSLNRLLEGLPNDEVMQQASALEMSALMKLNAAMAGGGEGNAEFAALAGAREYRSQMTKHRDRVQSLLDEKSARYGALQARIAGSGGQRQGGGMETAAPQAI